MTICLGLSCLGHAGWVPDAPRGVSPPDHPAWPCPGPPLSLPACLAAEIRGNTLMLAGAAAVGATGSASISLAQGSSVVNNKAMLVGALAVGGDASLSVQLSGSNVTGNALTAMGGVAVGGQGSAAVSGQNSSDVLVLRNTLDWQAALVTEQPLVTSVVNGLVALGGCPPACLPACFLRCTFQLPACPPARLLPASPPPPNPLLPHRPCCASASRQHLKLTTDLAATCFCPPRPPTLRCRL